MAASSLAVVWAQAANGVIGEHGALPWHLPEDLAHFRALTTGSTVLMGRATWDSLPARFRPLPDRANVVLTRDPSWAADGARRAGSVEQAVADAVGAVWVIGGASVYAAALPLAERAEVTELREAFAGDVTAPRLGAEWAETTREPAEGWRTSRTGLAFRTRSFRRSTP